MDDPTLAPDTHDVGSPPPQPVARAASDDLPSDNDRLLAALCHGSVFVGLGLVLPGILWVIKREESPYVAYHAVQALLFQGVGVAIMMALTLGLLILTIVTFGLASFLFFLIAPIGMLLMAGSAYGAWLGWQGEWKGYPGVEHLGR